MRVVLDTNVLIAAFVWRRSLTPIHNAIRDKKIIPCFTDETFSELKRALLYPKFELQLLRGRITPESIVRLLANRAHFVSETRRIIETKEDPSDNHILACAISARASFVVSGDKDLLKLANFDGIPIISPKAFIERHL